MRKFISFLVCFSMALVFCGKSHALVSVYETDKIRVEVWAQNKEINPTQNFELLTRFILKNGWHILANPAGDVGKPTVVDIALPQGYELLSGKWSAHKRFETEGIVQYGWDDEAYYKMEIKPESLSGDVVEIPLKIEWQACKDECITEKFELVKAFKQTELNPMVFPQYLEMSKNADALLDVGDKDWRMILLFAFLGGLILNFMPCVFPILSLKLISLVHGNENKQRLRLDSLLYLLGVVLSFMIVAGIMFWLRSQGEAIGWGFQLQSPWFVLSILVIFLLVFLMLMDWVRIPVLGMDAMNKISGQRNRIGAFLTGFFAVLIASPCTAPFMGIAIGYTLTQSPIMYFPVFLAIALGYALPFTLAGFFPKILYLIMPKSGRWMLILKKIFAIPVFFTCVWLVWILFYQLGVWNGKENTLQWKEYDAEQVELLKAEGKPVFIDFTAKWCLTCLLNDKAVLNTDEFEELVAAKNIYLFKADWTNENAEITQALAKYGRNSIPLYIYYNGESDEAVILPQLLTISVVKKYIQ